MYTLYIITIVAVCVNKYSGFSCGKSAIFCILYYAVTLNNGSDTCIVKNGVIGAAFKLIFLVVKVKRSV